MLTAKPTWTPRSGWERWIGRLDKDLCIVSDLPPAAYELQVVCIGDPPRPAQVQTFSEVPGSAGFVEGPRRSGRVKMRTRTNVPEAVLSRLEASPGEPVFLQVRRKNSPRPRRSLVLMD